LFLLHVSAWASLEHYHKQIDDFQLYDERFWHLLLHVNANESEIDDPNFFVDPNGKKDVKAELHATLESLYDTSYVDDNASQCRFPARTRWLKAQLNLEDLPEVTCKAYETLYEKIDPHSVTLVFADAHINSPGSMFGHTFLRINSTQESRHIYVLKTMTPHFDVRLEKKNSR
jgi:hypothetical protein